MRLIYGTTNQAKILFMKGRVEPLGIEILGLNDIDAAVPDIDESGEIPLENARIKALAYYRALNAPVFSCDSGLYIDGLDDARQPKTHVRQVAGRRLDDDGMIAYYSALAAELGGQMTARYRNAICLVFGEAEVYEHDGEDIASERFLIMAKPHAERREGFPLDSLSAHIETGKYFFDESDYFDKYSGEYDGFAAFFKRVREAREKDGGQ